MAFYVKYLVALSLGNLRFELEQDDVRNRSHFDWMEEEFNSGCVMMERVEEEGSKMPAFRRRGSFRVEGVEYLVTSTSRPTHCIMLALQSSHVISTSTTMLNKSAAKD